MTVKKIKEMIADRMNGRLKDLYFQIAVLIDYHTCDRYFVAGNSCNAAPPHDFDIYPCNEPFDFSGIKTRAVSVGGKVLSETKNALTVDVKGKILQFCKYKKNTLYELLESFDFAHIQVGVEICILEEEYEGNYCKSFINQVEYTLAWRDSHMLETTWYDGSEYPLSSLLRAGKYLQYGCYSRKHEYRIDVLNILRSIILRGFVDYDDFKDQLAAIDLQLDDDENNAAFKLYEACVDAGLVMHYDSSTLNSEEED